MIRYMQRLRPLPINGRLLSTTPNAANVDQEEMDKFGSIGNNIDWWDPKSDMNMLHRMNKVRVPFIRDGLINGGKADSKYVNTDRPLTGLKLLDVGCGGGFLCEPLARLGADVIGLDASPEMINIAQKHQQLDSSLTNLTYMQSTINDIAAKNGPAFDAVVASEVVEHVTEKEDFLKHCVASIKPGGSIFITTLNKTLASKVFGIYMAEYVFAMLPKGTHEHDKFISPHCLQRMLEELNCRTTRIHGTFGNPFTRQWKYIDNVDIHYALQAVKY